MCFPRKKHHQQLWAICWQITGIICSAYSLSVTVLRGTYNSSCSQELCGPLVETDPWTKNINRVGNSWEICKRRQRSKEMSPRKATLRYWNLNQVKETQIFRQVKKVGEALVASPRTWCLWGIPGSLVLPMWHGMQSVVGKEDRKMDTWAEMFYTLIVLLHVYLEAFCYVSFSLSLFSSLEEDWV